MVNLGFKGESANGSGIALFLVCMAIHIAFLGVTNVV